MRSVYTSGEVIFSLDGWEIHKTLDGNFAFEKIDSIIYHECDQVHATDKSYQPPPHLVINPDVLHRTCVFCGNPPPDEVQALWLLHNMDVL